MFARFVVALLLGALLGLERELVGKESAGIRTTMLVTSGASIFTMVGLTLPYIVSAQTGNLVNVIASNSGYLTMIGNIVVGIGFLGAGLIIKTDNQPARRHDRGAHLDRGSDRRARRHRAHTVRVRRGGAPRDSPLPAPQTECE